MVDETTKQENDIILNAHLAAERLEKANAEMRALVEEQKKIDARRILGGQSNAGMQQQKPELTQQEKINIGAKQYFKGTAIEGLFK